MNSPKGFSVVRIERNGAGIEVSPSCFRVSGPDTMSGVVVVVGYGGVSLEGRVAAAKGPIPQNVGVRVETKPLSRDATAAQPVRVDSQGHFRLEGLANGDYELVFSYWGAGTTQRTKIQRVTIAGGQAPPVAVTLDL